MVGTRKPVLLGSSLRLPAGTTARGAGWQSVCRLWRAGRGGLVPAGSQHPVFEPRSARHLYRWRLLPACTEPAMTTPHSPPPRPIQEAPSAAPALDPNSLIAILHAIGAGAAADGQPWPERHHLRSRQMALSDADCALTGQRIVQEILLAAERTRQNGEPEQYVGDRVMEGLVMADLALTAFIHERVRPKD
ncbi:conserved hypothetical exported protein [Stenotrophomonas maltophilia K279a]|nr:conserved hypothetical exported protein [Stenotrophomonas maltophilia K279a]